MAIEEKRAWIMLLVSVCMYAVYAVIVVGRLLDSSAAEVSYEAVAIWTIAISIAVQIVLHIAVRAAAPEDAGKRDLRDREIGMLSTQTGHAFTVLGGLCCFFMALGEVDHFWIANAMYLAFTLGAIVESLTKIGAYRWGFQRW